MARSSLGRDSFFRRGVITACLKSAGTVESAIHRFISWVMDGSRMFKYCFKTLVGRKSKTQEESEEDRIVILTSASVAKSNLVGTEPWEGEWGDELSVRGWEFRRQILSLKEERKDEASKGGQEWEDRRSWICGVVSLSVTRVAKAYPCSWQWAAWNSSFESWWLVF